MSAATHDTNAALDFLDRMFGADIVRHLVAINEDGKIVAQSFDSSKREAARAWIEGRQGNFNLYYSVNKLKPSVSNRKASKQDVESALHLHVDVDDPNALERISGFAPKPTAVVFSGGGFQVFWRLKESTHDLNRVERINAELAQKLRGDKSHNVDRIMRLPGTINVPNTKKRKAGRFPTLAFVVESETDWSRSYSLDDFGDANGEPSEAATHTPRAVEPVELDQLPSNIFEGTIELIKCGDDPSAPIGSKDAHFPSRSEAVWRVACELAQAGCSAEFIAGVLINPALGISQSVREKKRPIQYAIRQEKQALSVISSDWPDATKEGRPRPTMRNAMVAMKRVGLQFEHDLFRHRKTVEGAPIEGHRRDLSDDACTALRVMIIDQFGFDVGKDATRDAAEALAITNPVHPICTYLNGVRWDGAPRLDSWMSTYLGAERTPLNSAIGRIVLIAAVRRVRSPGVKFDTILVLEGEQGIGKSSAIKILAGLENFSDQNILTLESKGQMELLEGVWIYELCELEGLSRAETSKVKAFASRSHDQGRPAYGRFKETRPRQTVFIGTTNENQYLRDPTGNRRFWPVKVGRIDLEGLRRDRDQLFAEAAYWEEKGESLVLPEELWPAAQVEQDARVEDDPWADVLAKLHPSDLDQVAGMARVASSELIRRILGLEPERQQQHHLKRVAAVMRKLGWEGPVPIKMADGSVVRGYQRPLSDWGDPHDPSFRRKRHF